MKRTSIGEEREGKVDEKHIWKLNENWPLLPLRFIFVVFSQNFTGESHTPRLLCGRIY
jgi:hypothetical protein